MANRCYSVFVGHLNPETKKHELRDLFEKCGQVVDIFIRPNERPGGWNYGFVRYWDLQSAEKAIRELHRWEVCGSHILVQLAKDTIARVKAEKELEEKKATIARRPRVSDNSSNIIEDTMYLARVKETCTTLGLNHTDGEDRIGYLLEDVQKCDPNRNATQWSPLSDPITSFDLVSEKLVSRSQEGGDKGRLLGAKKSQEFMSSLKTIMQEIEDFLSQTARNASNSPATSETNDHVVPLSETHVSEENINKAGNVYIEAAASKVSNEVSIPESYKHKENINSDIEESSVIGVNEDRKILSESVCVKEMRSSGDGSSLEYLLPRNGCNRNCTRKDGQMDKTSTVGKTDSVLSNTEHSKHDRVTFPVIRQESANVAVHSVTDRASEGPVIPHVNKRVRSLDAASLTYSPVVSVKFDEETDCVQDRDIKRQVVKQSNKRVRSLDSANLSFSQIVHVDSEEFENNVGAETAVNIKDLTHSPVASFYLTESPKVEINEIDKAAEVTLESFQIHDTEVNHNLSKTDQRLGNVLEYRNISKGVHENKSDDCVKRRTRSADSDLFKTNSLELNSEADPYDSKHYNHNQNDIDNQHDYIIKPGAKGQIDLPENTVVNEKLNEALALETLFANLPPLTSFERSNSRESSLSDNSVEGVDDSGVESDFLLRSDRSSGFQPSLQDHSDQLKQMLGIGSSVNSDNIQLGQRFQSLKSRLNSSVTKQDSSTRHTAKGTQLPFYTQTPYGRGRGFNL